MKKFKLFFVIFFLLSIILPISMSAAELVPDQVEVIKAKVLEIETKEARKVPGLDVDSGYQSVTAQILEGSKKGETVTFDNDFIQLKKGQVFYLSHTISADNGREFFSVQDTYRLPVLYFFITLFIVLVILIGGLQGVRGLLSLVGSFLLIMYVLLPGILHGFSPILVSIAVSSLIIILGSYVTHGFNKTTSSAVLGMIITIVFTGIMAYVAVHLAQFTGYSTEEAFYFNLNTRGNINILGILIGGMMIGLLGILYDVSIGQAISVEELHHIAPHIPKATIFKRAIRIGREHIGALVNTLAIAYVGASLPLFLFFSTPPINFLMTINREVFATEILRILIGSIGLVLAVPITTFIAVLILVKINPVRDREGSQRDSSSNGTVLQKENEALKHFEHHH